MVAAFWKRLFGLEPDALRAARAAAERGEVGEAWAHAVAGLGAPRAAAALHGAAEIARLSGRAAIAPALDRAGDDPSDTSRLADAAATCARAGELEAAIAIFERALALAPFDAVLRSELALVLARAARPAESVAVLALHPCLADDPGALFQFAWSSLLAGDPRTAAECLETLGAHRSARALVSVLEGALARSAAAPSGARDLRDWLFIEHGALLLDRSGPHDGAHGSVEPGEALADLVAARVAAALGAPPPRVIAGDEASRSSAHRVATELGLESAEPPPRAGFPDGLVVLRRARDLAPLLPRLGTCRTLALVLEIDDTPAVPDLVGAVTRACGPGRPAADPREPAAIAAFASARRALLPPSRVRAIRAFLPDAPLRWPVR